MAEFPAKTFLYSTEAIVFAVLTFLLWMFYRGFGRQYVKLWTLSLSALSVNQITLAIQSYKSLELATQPDMIFYQWLQQSSSYLFLVFFFIGIISAKTQKRIDNKTIYLSSITALTIATFATLLCAFEPQHTYDRFYLRVTLNAFVFACGFLASGAFLMLSKKHHFSSRIIMYLSIVVGSKFLFFSFASTIAINEDWFSELTLFNVYFDNGIYAVIGFSMLIWLQGAERSAAVSAISRAQYLGKHDALTGTLNREQVIEKLPKAMEKSVANQSKLSIFLIDIKRFKFINDTFGLKVGDHILGEVAKRLSDSIFKPAIVGRLSGDSFIFVIEFDDENQIQHATSHIHELIERPYVFDEHEIVIHCSLGYNFYPEHADNAENLLQNANLALFHAESQNIPSAKFEPEMQIEGRHLIGREKEIRSAIENDEFILYFQPQLNLLTNRLEGVEALIRWQHPDEGFLTPNKFLDDVDALGLNSEFDSFVLDKACQTIANWYEVYKRRVAVAVNITAVEFQDPKLVSKIQNLLFKYDIPPNYLELEITENVVMTDIDTAMDTIVALQNMGIKVSIDDFGTGYSSLSYLRKLPIDKIKIDRSFVHEMASNDSDLTIVKSMIKLSHGLGKRVLAEGVETSEQLEVLRKLGCDAVQGYYISKPVCEQDLGHYFKRK